MDDLEGEVALVKRATINARGISEGGTIQDIGFKTEVVPRHEECQGVKELFVGYGVVLKSFPYSLRLYNGHDKHVSH